MNGSYSDTKSFSLTVSPAPVYPPSITTSSLPDATLNSSYSLQLEAVSDTSVTWFVSGLPDGMSATTSGYISGIPQYSGTYWLYIYAENEGGSDSRSFIMTVLEPTGIPVDSSHFPDSIFRSYVSNTFDLDSNGYLDDSEISAITYINVYGKGVENVEGIEYFTELAHLTVWNNNLTYLDVSANTQLTYLDLDNNHVEELDLWDNPLLRTLYCTNNNLEYLDLSNNPELQTLYCNGNKLTTLDLSNNPELTSIGISNQNVSGLHATKRAENDYYEADLGGLEMYEYDDEDGVFSRVNADTVRS